MSNNNETANTTNDQSNRDAEATAKELLRELQPLWQTHRKRGLEVRHQTGRRLNDKLGSPEMRQKYGCEVVKRISRELGLNKSEVSRMRWFAHKFGSVEQLFQLHPTVRTWTWAAVKPLLVQKPSNDGEDKGDVKSASRIEGVENQLLKSQSIMESIRSSLDDEDRGLWPMTSRGSLRRRSRDLGIRSASSSPTPRRCESSMRNSSTHLLKDSRNILRGRQPRGPVAKRIVAACRFGSPLLSWNARQC